MADNPQTPQPPQNVEGVGQAVQWSDEDMDRLIGLDGAGKIKPAVMAAVMADAAQHPALWELLNADLAEPEE